MRPRSWAEVYERLAFLLGADLPSAQEWVREALTASWGHPDPADLPRSSREVALQRCAGVVLRLEDMGEIAFDVDLRLTVATAFARHFSGFWLEGPPWRISPAEMERPSYDEWAASLYFE